MSAKAGCRALRAVCTAMLLAVPCLGDGVSDDGAPSIRRIFVPAAAPERWPLGDWVPIPLADLERELAARQQDRIETLTTGLERAEYQAKLVGDTLRHGTFEWKLTQSPTLARFLRLDPLNLAIFSLEWIDAENGNRIGPVVWGTTPSQTAGLVRHPSDALAVGAWSLVGRSLTRSTEFEVRVPPAMVSHFVLQVPEGLIPTTTAGELAGPHPAPEPGFLLWELHLGSRTSARLRFSPPIAETARRPLVVARSRTKYVVRPEVVHVFAEFDVEVYETAVRELRLQIDEGLQVVGVEYGDDDEVGWRVVDGSDGRAIVVQLPDSVTGPGQVLRVHGIAPGKPRQSWSIPRLYLPDAVETESQVTIRLQPPYQAADLQFDGFRQIELNASPTDGETVVLRQLKAGASLVVVPSSPRLTAACRSVTLARLEGEEWTLTAMMDLHATAGSAFEALSRVPEDWEIVNVQSDSESGAGNLAGWEVVTLADGESRLHLDFVTALSPTHPQRLRVTARRNPVESGRELSVPALILAGAVEVDAASIVVDGPGQRTVCQESAGWEMSTLADLSSADQSLDFVRALPATARSSAVVFRTSAADASGTLMLRSLDGADSQITRGDVDLARVRVAATESLQVEKAETPIVAVLVDARVRLDGAEKGFDLYHVNSDLSGSDGADLRWELPENAESIDVRLNDRSVEPRIAGSIRSLQIPSSTVQNRGRHNLSLEYRVPCVRQFGPNRRRIALPRIRHPILGCRLNILIPRSLRLVAPPAGMALHPDVVAAQSIFGPLARCDGESIFHPFDVSDWHRMSEHLDGASRVPTTIIDARANHQDPLTATFPNQKGLHADGFGETWTGSNLMVPDKLDLVVWDREQASSLSWVVLSLSMLTTVALRMIRFQGLRLTATFAVAILSGAVWALPPLYAQIAGTALISIAIGTLVPQRWLFSKCPTAGTDPLSVPSGSTRSFATASFLSLLPVAYLAYAACAQVAQPAPADPMERTAVHARERIDVLIPTRTDGRPSGSNPLCYVSADVMKRLQSKHGVPPYLLNAAAINATVTEGRQVDVGASFDVYVLSEDATVRVELPLTNVVLGGTNACHVDGRPHPVMLGAEGRGLIVELAGQAERPAPVSLPSSETMAVPKSSTEDSSVAVRKAIPFNGAFATAGPFIAHRIDLRFHPHVELESNETFVARLGIPVVSDTSVRFTANGESVALSAAPRPGEAAQSFRPDGTTLSRVVARLRPTGELQFRWSRSRQASQAPAVELTALVNGVIDVSPALANSTYQVEYRVHAGAIDSLVWKLPRGSTLVSVQSPGMSGYVFESGEGDTRRLLLEYATPQTGNIVVTANLVQPVPRGAVECDLPLLELDGTSDQLGHTTIGRYQVAFLQPVDFRLKVAAAALSLVLKPRAIEDFLKDWPVIGARLPQQVYELIRPGDLRLTLQELPAVLTAKTESRGYFGKGRLDWTFVAEIEQPVVPPFQYRLHVDPRLRIRKVSVQEGEDGADRLLRWSQLNDTLVLFLNDRAVRSQILRVAATLPIADPTDVELPNIELAGASSGPSTVTLTYAPDVLVSLVGEGASIVEDGSTSRIEQDQTGENSLEVRIDKNAAGLSAPRVRIKDAPPVSRAVIATALRRTEDGNMLTTAVEYAVRSGRVLQFEMELPSDLAQRGRIETSVAVETIRRSLADGRTSITFFPLQPVTGKFQVTLKVPVVVPSSGEWSVPVVTAGGVPVGARFLLLSGEYAVALEASAMPEWIPALFDSEVDVARVACYSLPTGELSTTIRMNSDVRSEESPDTLADVTIEIDSDGALWGRYVLWLPSHPPDAVSFDWPQKAAPVALFSDGRALPVPSPNDGVLTLPLPGDATRKLICVTWVDRNAPPIGLLGVVRPKLPAPRNVAIATESLKIRMSPRLVVRGRSDTTVDQDLEIALERWQAALSAIESQTTQPEEDGRSWLADYVRMAAADATRLASSPTCLSAQPHRSRIEILGRRTASLMLVDAKADGLKTDAFASVLSDEWHESDQRAVASIAQSINRPDSSGFNGAAIANGIWAFDRLAFNGLLGCLIALVVALTAWKTARFWLWLQQREALALVFLGLFWWLVLKSGVFGLVLSGLGVLQAVRAAVRRTRDDSDSLPAPFHS